MLALESLALPPLPDFQGLAGEVFESPPVLHLEGDPRTVPWQGLDDGFDSRDCTASGQLFYSFRGHSRPAGVSGTSLRTVGLPSFLVLCAELASSLSFEVGAVLFLCLALVA